MLADRAEDVCRAYLQGGSRNGGYWRVGSVDGEPGQSLWVNLKGDDRGRWKDEAVPDHKGDLLDLIRAAGGIGLTAAMDEAARFLGLPPPDPEAGSADRAFAAMLRDAVPVTPDDPAGRYLASRGLAAGDAEGCWFHPTLWVRVGGKVREEPALIVPLTGADGHLRAVHRIFVSEDGGKAAFEHHKRTKGSGKGLAARFGAADARRVVLCEGVEDALAVVRALDPEERKGVMVAASAGAGRIAGVELRDGVRRILHMQDRDRAGGTAWEALRTRWGEEHPDVVLVRAVPLEKDANAELLEHGPQVLRALLDPLFAANPPADPDAEGAGAGDMPTESGAAEGKSGGPTGSDGGAAANDGADAGDGPHTEGVAAEAADGAGDVPTESGAAEGKPDGTTGPEGIGADGGEADAAGAEAGPSDGAAVSEAEADAREWAAFKDDWNAFYKETEEAGVHPYAAQGYEDMHARMRALSFRHHLDPKARSWLGEQLTIHNEITGRRNRAKELVLGLRIVQDRRQAVADCGGDILRAGRYRAWKEEERRLAATGEAMLADRDYELALNGIEHARERLEWASRTIPSWHANDAQRLEAGGGAGVAW